MTGEQFRAMVREVCEDLCAMNENKGAEYAGEDDALAFFREAAAELGQTPEQIWAVLARKHWRSVVKFCGQGDDDGLALSEPIEGRAKDLVLYLLLFIAMRREPDPTSIDPGDRQDDYSPAGVRADGETTDEYTIFRRFVELGPERTIGRLAAVTPVGPAELQEMSNRLRWFQRAEAVDR